METFYESKYITIKFDPDRNILFSYWTTEEYMSDEQYREEVKNFVEGINTYKPTKILIHTADSKYVVPVETQDWMTAKLNPLYELYKIRKVAITMNSDFIAQLSFEQLAEEAIEDTENKNLQMQFFDSEEKAIIWLESKAGKKRKAA